MSFQQRTFIIFGLTKLNKLRQTGSNSKYGSHGLALLKLNSRVNGAKLVCLDYFTSRASRSLFTDLHKVTQRLPLSQTDIPFRFHSFFLLLFVVSRLYSVADIIFPSALFVPGHNSCTDRFFSLLPRPFALFFLYILHLYKRTCTPPPLSFTPSIFSSVLSFPFSFRSRSPPP